MPPYALAAAFLHAIQIGVGALGVAAARDSDHHIGVGNQILVREITIGGDDLGTPLVAVLLDDLGQLVADDLALPLRPGEDVGQVGDDSLVLCQLVDDPLPLQCGKPAQLHVQDRVRLQLVDLQQSLEPLPGIIGARLRRISAITSSN